MSIGIFIDRALRPTEAELAAVLGGAFGRWKELAEHVRKTQGVAEELKYLYGKTYGWGLQFRGRGKVLLSLFPNDQYFVALIILGVEELSEADELDLHIHAREAIAAANLYAEGKWLFITVRNKDDLNDVRSLLEIRTSHLQNRARG